MRFPEATSAVYNGGKTIVSGIVKMASPEEAKPETKPVVEPKKQEPAKSEEATISPARPDREHHDHNERQTTPKP
jgi:hypothetical protein